MKKILPALIIMSLLWSCYSFTGGTIPKHLKTMFIATVKDNSGYGNPSYRDILTNELISEFQNDNSFELVDRGGDAKLYVELSSINDATSTVRPGEVETERKITVKCDVEYYDAVEKKSIWKKSFSNYQVYSLSNVQQERDNAISVALESIAEDILLAVVSGW